MSQEFGSTIRSIPCVNVSATSWLRKVKKIHISVRVLASGMNVGNVKGRELLFSFLGLKRPVNNMHMAYCRDVSFDRLGTFV